MHHFELPELDRKKTKEAVEEALRTYRLYKYLAYEEWEPTITARYNIEGSLGSQTSDQTARVAIHNVDEQERRRRYCERIERAVSRLPRMERFLIEERYMTADADYLTDYAVYNFKFQPPISQPTYAKIRWRAFYRLALSLDLAVVKEGDDEGGAAESYK